MTKIKITQVKSGIDRPERQKLTLKALGLTKMNASREVEATAQILGMVRTVNHLLKIEEVPGDNAAVESKSQDAEITPAHSEAPEAAAPALPAASAEIEAKEPADQKQPDATASEITTPGA